MSATTSAAAVVSAERRGSGFVGVTRRGRALVTTCGCPGHLMENEARDCMISMAQAIGLKVGQAKT